MLAAHPSDGEPSESASSPPEGLPWQQRTQARLVPLVWGGLRIGESKV